MKQKVYITKYALTAGILEKEAEERHDNFNDKVLYALVKEDIGMTCYRIGIDAFYNIEDAKKNAEEKRSKKIESLKKQIKKLENIKFE